VVKLGAAAALALGGAMGRLAGPSPALAGQRRVVRCPYNEAQWTGFDVGGRHAQTFKAPVSGRLRQVTVRIDHPQTSSGDYVVQIVPLDAEGMPNAGRVLAEKVLPGSGFTFGEHPVTFAFGKGAAPALKQGKQYALVVSRSGGRFGLATRRDPNGGDPCRGTTLFTNSSATAGSFTKIEGFDHVFEVVIVAD
jgi:hypothetical protein